MSQLLAVLGRHDPLQSKRVHIVGAGIAGLLIARHYKERGYDVIVHESQLRAGGLISTEHTPNGMVERAAHSFLVTKEFQELAQRLAVTFQPVNPDHRGRYIWRKNKMQRMPLSLLEILRALGGALFLPLNKDDTLGSFADRVLGSAARRYLIEPGVTGIYAAAPQLLGLTAAFPSLRPLVGKPLVAHFLRRVKKQRASMQVFSGGTQTFINALIQDLGSNLRLGAQITDLDALRATGQVVVCSDAHSAASLLKGVIDDTTCQALAEVNYTPLMTCTVFVRREHCSRFCEGVGVLAPRGEGVKALGVLMNSSAFAGRVNHPDLHSLTVLYGGTHDPQALVASDADVLAWIRADLGLIMGLSHEPVDVVITRWPRAIPLYARSLEALWPRLNEALPPGVLLFGNYTGQVSVRGMVECLWGTEKLENHPK